MFTYILVGPEEDIPRGMDSFEFVCHAPSEYYKYRNTPYTIKEEGPEIAFISTTMGAQIRKLPSRDAIFGIRDIDQDESPEPVAPPREKVKEKSKDREEKKEKPNRKERKDTRERAKDKRSARDH